MTTDSTNKVIPTIEKMYNRLRVLRAERGLSRQDLASAVGVNYQTIGYPERGDYSPSLELAFRFSQFFSLSHRSNLFAPSFYFAKLDRLSQPGSGIGTWIGEVMTAPEGFWRPKWRRRFAVLCLYVGYISGSFPGSFQ